MGFSDLEAVGEPWRGKIGAIVSLGLAAVLRRALAGPDDAALEQDLSPLGRSPLGPIVAAGAEQAARRGAVDGVVVVPTGPLLSLRLDAVVMRQSPPV